MDNIVFMKATIFFFLLLTGSVQAQPAKQIGIQKCYELARQNYPLIKQRDLINKTRDYSVSNAAKGYIPRLGLVGQATYQSDVVEIPSPGIPALRKDQYKVGAELNQTIYDAGVIKYVKQSSDINAEIQQQSLEVNLFALQERINNIYFGLLYIDQQIKQNGLRENDLQNGQASVEASYANGESFKSNVDELKAEILNVDQSTIELKSNKVSYQEVLSIMINLKVDDGTVLEEPESIVDLRNDINRPEVKLYDIQKKNTDLMERQLKTGYTPSVNAFAQGYYGAPTYNFISNDPGFFGIVGISFKWNLYNLYTYKNSRSIYQLNRQNIDAQKETFLFNTRLSLSQDSQSVVKYNSLLSTDKQIIKLRSSVKDAAKAQLENGTLTSHDYITKVNDESQARLSLAQHHIQWLQSQYNFKNTSGN